jgi:hypothetical protein
MSTQLSRWQLLWFIDIALTSQLNFFPCKKKWLKKWLCRLCECPSFTLLPTSYFHEVWNHNSAFASRLKAILFHFLQSVISMLGTRNFWNANYALRVLLGTSPSLGKNSKTRLCWETTEQVRKIVLGYAKDRCEDQGWNPVFTNLHFIRKWSRKHIDVETMEMSC